MFAGIGFPVFLFPDGPRVFTSDPTRKSVWDCRSRPSHVSQDWGRARGVWNLCFEGFSGESCVTEVGIPRPWAFVLNLGAKGPWPSPPA